MDHHQMNSNDRSRLPTTTASSEPDNNMDTNDNRYYVPQQQQQQQQQGETSSALEHELRSQLIMAGATTATIPRSSPIAIVQSPDGTTNNRRRRHHNRRNHIDGDSDSDHHDHHHAGDTSDDDDDDDSSVDYVEKDAIKLQKKYGGKIVQTYQATSTILSNTTATTATTNASSALNAPYLGSLSRSQNQVLSLPPMSLASNDNNNHTEDNVLGEPPEAIGSYGSLRDSHQRGRFLDGPSSYREPTSGRIRQLDHRLRYHGSRQQPAELSIGERMQQASKKLKEKRRKMEQQEQKQDGGEGEGEMTDKTRSSLSAMMNEVVSNESSTPKQTGRGQGSTGLGEEFMIPVKMHDDAAPRTTTTTATTSQTTLFDNDMDNDDDRMVDSPHFMLSTSLTAFEIMKTSNSITASSQYRHVLNQSVSAVPNNPGSTTTATTCTGTSGVSGDKTSYNNKKQPQRFQPLARSMSDPTPRFYQMSLRDNNNNAGVPLPPSPLLSAAQHIQQQQLAATQQQQQQQGQHPSTMSTAGTTRATVTNPNTTIFGNTPMVSAIQGRPYNAAPSTPDYGFIPNTTTRTTSNPPDHDPDTDGAFGDMDME